MKIQILLFDGVEEMDAIAPYEVLCAARNFGSAWSVELATLEPRDKIVAAYGLAILPQGVFHPRTPPDILIVPGGGWISRAKHGAWAERSRGVIPEAIATAYNEGALVAGICSGAMLVQAAGILEGKPAVTHHSALEELRQTGTRIENSRVVDAGDVITCGGVTAGIDLALHLVARLVSPSAANEVANYLEHPPVREWHAI